MRQALRKCREENKALVPASELAKAEYSQVQWREKAGEERLRAETAERQLAQAKAEIAGLRADKIMLDWLEDKERCYHVTVQSQPSGEFIFDGHGVGLRHAIDEALAKPPAA